MQAGDELTVYDEKNRDGPLLRSGDPPIKEGGQPEGQG